MQTGSYGWEPQDRVLFSLLSNLPLYLSMFWVLSSSARTFRVQKKESANLKYLPKNTPPPGIFSRKVWWLYKGLLHLDSWMEEDEGQSCRVLCRVHSDAHISALWLCMFLYVLWTWSWHPGKTVMSGRDFTWAYVVTLGSKPRKSEGSNRHFQREQDGNQRRKRARVFQSHLVDLAQGWLIIHHHRTRRLFQKGLSVEGNRLGFYGINPGD